VPSRDHFINKLRELGYSYRGETKRTQKWKRGTHRVNLPRNSVLAEDWCRMTLRQCGVDDVEIESFIRACNT
jgi:hypothetical protein